jgi:uncharacterized protein (TIGR02266 family)
MPMVRIQLRYPDEATFIQRFSPNVTRGGIFLASRSPHPVGTVVAFEVAIIQGPPLLAGTGKVTWVREFNPEEPQRAHGMGVQFLQLTPSCRPLLERLLAYKARPARYTPVAGVPTVAENAERHDSAPRTSSPSPDGDPSIWIDDLGVRQAVDRARVLANKVEDVESLRVREREDPASLEEALAALPRLLGSKR